MKGSIYIGHCRGHDTITMLFKFQGWKLEHQRMLKLNFSFRYNKTMSLRFNTKCLDCNNSEYFELQASPSFNKEGYYIAKFKKYMFFCHRLFKKCKTFLCWFKTIIWQRIYQGNF